MYGRKKTIKKADNYVRFTLLLARRTKKRFRRIIEIISRSSVDPKDPKMILEATFT